MYISFSYNKNKRKHCLLDKWQLTTTSVTTVVFRRLSSCRMYLWLVLTHFQAKK